MSTAPDGGSPFEYDFSLEQAADLPHYDPDEIMERAVWPTVDHLWRSDWRGDARPGQELTFPATGAHDNVVLGITLSAHCYGIPGEDLQYNMLGHGVTVQLEEDAPEELRELIMHRARTVEPDLMAGFEDYEGLILRKGIAYSFDTEEEAEINAFQSVESADGSVIWVSERLDEEMIEDMDGNEDEAEDILFDTDRFRLHDIGNLTVALSILGAPEACLRAMEAIRKQPIQNNAVADNG